MTILKNLKISKKLWLIVLPMTIALIAFLLFFVYTTETIGKESRKALYDEAFVNTALILNADRDFYQADVAEKELVLSGDKLSAEKEKELIDSYNENAAQVEERISQAAENAKKNTELYSKFTDYSAGITFEQLYANFQSDFKTWKEAYDINTGKGDIDSKIKSFDSAREDINSMTELLESYANKQSEEIGRTVTFSAAVSSAVVAGIILIIFAFAIFIIRYLKKNILYATGISKRIADGDLSIEIDESKLAKDELGQLCEAIAHMLTRLQSYSDYIKEIAEVLEKIADGDMNIELSNDYAGEFASIKDALLKISSSLSQTLKNILVAADEVNVGAEQVSASAQTISQGATEQASTIEQLSASVIDVSDSVHKNAENTRHATEYVENTVLRIEESNSYMKRMLESMNDISVSSNEIGKIISVIDEIAFQTNILALNAAVEAARAGTAGKGFAVVADEVRNLASKSADAAKQTTVLIQKSIKAVSEGSKTADETAKSLESVSENSMLVKDLIEKINAASSSQELAINQIKQGLDQILTVVQNNSATAEENAAASEELSGQANMLKREINKFNLM